MNPIHAGEALPPHSQVPGDQLDRDRLVRLAYRFLWNQADAEDAAQSALLIACRRKGDLRDPANWWSWMCRIVVRQCHEISRRRGRWRRHMPRLFAAKFASEEQAFEPADAAADTADWIRRWLPKLPARQRDVLVLRHLEGMSFEQIAAVLEIAPSTARVHAQAGREALRELMLAAGRKGSAREPS